MGPHSGAGMCQLGAYHREMHNGDREMNNGDIHGYHAATRRFVAIHPTKSAVLTLNRSASLRTWSRVRARSPLRIMDAADGETPKSAPSSRIFIPWSATNSRKTSCGLSVALPTVR